MMTSRWVDWTKKEKNSVKGKGMHVKCSVALMCTTGYFV